MTRNREDLDALLISALYGELSPGQRVELDAHLAAHPGDRGVLDQLALARQLVQTSGVLVPHLDPAPAVSAQLVQAAARRAPARASAPGLWSSVVGLFAGLGRHPAAASAAALVLVAGVWGVLSMSDAGRKSAVATAPPAIAEPSPAAGSATAPATTPPGEAASAADRGYQAQLADGVDSLELARTEGGDAARPADAVETGDGKIPGKRQMVADRKPAAGEKKSKEDTIAFEQQQALGVRKDAAKVRGVEVTTTDPALKAADAELDDAGNELAGAADDLRDRAVAPRSGGAATAKAGVSKPSVAPPPAAPTQPEASTEVARTLHRRMVDLVKANKCTDAGKVGRDLYARFPDYYAEFVANDRAVAPCKSYTERERRKQAEETSKSRAPNASSDAVK